MCVFNIFVHIYVTSEMFACEIRNRRNKENMDEIVEEPGKFFLFLFLSDLHRKIFFERSR